MVSQRVEGCVLVQRASCRGGEVLERCQVAVTLRHEGNIHAHLEVRRCCGQGLESVILEKRDEIGREQIDDAGNVTRT